MNSFDKNLKRLRIRNHLKQEDLAKQLNVTRQTVSGWETGRRQPDLDMLKKLAEALDVDMQELIYGVTSNAYPRFQGKYVICTAVSGSITVLLLLFRLLLLPYIEVLCNTHHWGTVLTICTILLPQIGAFAFGTLFPWLIRLFIPIPIKKKCRIWGLITGLTLFLPVVLFWLGIRPYSRWILTRIGNPLLIHVLPAIAGLLISIGVFSEIKD
jgi:transcriptional regulator with XRE-family HTH domain